jgi:hypothetical protein
MTTFVLADLPSHITIIITTVDMRKWSLPETMTTFVLIALMMDGVVLKMRRSLRLVTMAMIIFNGQCSLQENKANRTWCHVSQSAPQRKSCSPWESGLAVWMVFLGASTLWYVALQSGADFASIVLKSPVEPHR